MRRSVLRWIASLPLAASGVLLAGCGGSGGNGAPIPADPPAPEPEDPPPAGRQRNFAYVVGAGPQNVAVFELVDDGQLKPVQTFATGNDLVKLVFHPSGNYAYVADRTVGIRVFAVDRRTGILNEIAEVPLNANRLVLHPSGAYLYADTGSQRLIRFTVEANGLLREEESIQLLSTPLALAIDDPGRFLFASTSDGVASYSVERGTGILTPAAAVSGGARPFSMLVLPGSTHLLAGSSGAISVYPIDSDSGIQGLISDVQTGGLTHGVALDPQGRFLYAAMSDTDQILGYAVDPIDGLLQELTPGFVNSPQPHSLAFAPSGRFLYATNRGANSVSIYAVRETGELASMQPAVALALQPRGITVASLQG